MLCALVAVCTLSCVLASREVWPRNMVSVTLELKATQPWQYNVKDFSPLLTHDVVAAIAGITDQYADDMDGFCEIYRDIQQYSQWEGVGYLQADL
ncbi:hypothetical protein KIPB_002990, partial [Kipferlia bialata]|eukprot:g2990.t1